ncbi:hypothetical protein O181_048608 [Austropuccinia psidii MF-1]|uniref:Uncharacterized protein n=1 Tax=Austropuccinia psidii MF-1 TaxID=1389203 RepID=A0A9Q3DW25_9BASI|nr:hypothetical protein [Austropuccinia psidii MF-1]
MQLEAIHRCHTLCHRLSYKIKWVPAHLYPPCYNSINVVDCWFPSAPHDCRGNRLLLSGSVLLYYPGPAEACKLKRAWSFAIVSSLVLKLPQNPTPSKEKYIMKSNLLFVLVATAAQLISASPVIEPRALSQFTEISSISTLVRRHGYSSQNDQFKSQHQEEKGQKEYSQNGDGRNGLPEKTGEENDDPTKEDACDEEDGGYQSNNNEYSNPGSPPPPACDYSQDPNCNQYTNPVNPSNPKESKPCENNYSQDPNCKNDTRTQPPGLKQKIKAQKKVVKECKAQLKQAEEVLRQLQNGEDPSSNYQTVPVNELGTVPANPDLFKPNTVPPRFTDPAQ